MKLQATKFNSVRFGTFVILFRPTFVTGLKFWLNPDIGAYQTSGGSLSISDGDPVGELQDQSGGGFHMAQATSTRRPTFKFQTHNGKSTILFDGTDDRMASSTVSHSIGTGNFWWIVCVKIGTGSTTKPYLTNGSFAPRFGLASTNKVRMEHTAVTYDFNSTLVAGTFYILELIRTSGVLRCYVNGVQEATTHAYTTSISNAVARIGDDDGTNFFSNNSNQGQTLMYTASPSVSDRSSLINYLGDYYGVVVTP